MNLSRLIDSVWRDARISSVGFRKWEVKLIIEVFLDKIVESLLMNNRVKLQGFATLKVKKAKGKMIRNPKTRKLMNIKDYYKVCIEPSKRLKDGMKKLI